MRTERSVLPIAKNQGPPIRGLSDHFVFILWSHARALEREILQELSESYLVKAVLEVVWSQDQFSNNMTRFYGTLLPPGSFKEEHCGRGPFLLIVVRDHDPTYEWRCTSKGWQQVNRRTFDDKTRFRSWTGGGHRVHSTNTPTETARDLALILGPDEAATLISTDMEWQGPIRGIGRDLAGTRGWVSLQEMFSVLNHTQTYVVLRNFEGLPDSTTAEGHEDIDLLVDSFADAVWVLNARPAFQEPWRVHVKATVAGEPVYLDVRHVGDGYYDQYWQRNILATRRMLDTGIYVPDLPNHFASLLYHALIHKPEVASDYKVRLSALGSQIGISLDWDAAEHDGCHPANVLGEFLSSHQYKATRPDDLSVMVRPDSRLPEDVAVSNVRAGRATVQKLLQRVGLLGVARRFRAAVRWKRGRR